MLISYFLTLVPHPTPWSPEGRYFLLPLLIVEKVDIGKHYRFLPSPPLSERVVILVRLHPFSDVQISCSPPPKAVKTSKIPQKIAIKKFTLSKSTKTYFFPKSFMGDPRNRGNSTFSILTRFQYISFVCRTRGM